MKPWVLLMSAGWGLGCTDVEEQSPTGSTEVAEPEYVSLTCGSLSSGGPDKDGDGLPFIDPETHGESPLSCYWENREKNYIGEIVEPDCDDEDPEKWRFAFLDQDLDGFGDREAPVCVGDDLPNGVVYDSSDCNDQDPERFRLYVMDQDQDGYGHPDKACAGKDRPEGAIGSASASEIDCADEDFEINPGAVDLVGDGIDTNCDGVDGAPWPELKEPLEASPSSPQCSDSSDLYIAGWSVVPPTSYFCIGTVIVALGNRGGMTSQGAELVFDDPSPQPGFEEQIFPLPEIAPGDDLKIMSLGQLPLNYRLRIRHVGASDGCSDGEAYPYEFGYCHVR